MNNQSSVFVSIVGCPNVGKSSILNALLGQKIAIVTKKPQTTRTKITGVLTQGDVQFVFADTPGFHKPRNKLGEHMVRAVSESISGVDVCLFVVEPAGELRETEEELLARFQKASLPVILVINKIDTLTAEGLAARIEQLRGLYPFLAVVPVSSRRGDNLPQLLKEIAACAVPGVHFFPEDSLTDQPERILAAEMIREKLLLLLDQEIPHEIAVMVEKMHERDDGLLDVQAIVYCSQERHKGIIIGKGGAMLKQASTMARKDMERFFDCPVNLRCFVKVKEGWRNREGLLRDFGLE